MNDRWFVPIGITRQFHLRNRTYFINHMKCTFLNALRYFLAEQSLRRAGAAPPMYLPSLEALVEHPGLQAKSSNTETSAQGEVFRGPNLAG